ncbi:MAG: phosphomannomutase/phosphoglucomutase [Firmicutes bacterium]|nr:phosphomannomutase/phosphoglucomutase [Bacillota bacterium]
MSLKVLKSGSDIRGTAIAANGETVNLTQEVVSSLGGAFVSFLAKHTGKTELKLAVGNDPRLSGEALKEALIAVFKRCGTTIYDSGLTSTPAMFEMTRHAETDCDGAVMITASHHPFHKNGLKFFTKTGGLTAEQLDEVISLAEQGAMPEGDKTILYRRDFLKLYADKLVAYVRAKTGEETPLYGLKIVVDAGHGSGGFFADKILQPLGADTTGSQFLHPDGNFPAHAPNPEDSAAMRSISDCVINTGADLGIIFDTDVDRAAIVNKGGEEINRNKLIALAAAIVLEENPGATIVTDSVTSDGLKKFIYKKGGEHFRYKRGYQHVIGKAKALNAEGRNAVLAMETSGHAAFRENGFLDDGAYLAVKILVKLAALKKEGKELVSCISELESPKSRFETRIFFKDVADYKTYGDTIVNALTDFSKKLFTLEPSTYEGVRVNVDAAQGWFLLRQSVHDPNMALNIESELPQGAKIIAKIIYKYLSGFSGLDCPGLKVFTE